MSTIPFLTMSWISNQDSTATPEPSPRNLVGKGNGIVTLQLLSVRGEQLFLDSGLDGRRDRTGS